MKTLALVIAVLITSLANAGTPAFVPSATSESTTVTQQTFEYFWSIAEQEVPWTLGTCMTKWPGHNYLLAYFTSFFITGPAAGVHFSGGGGDYTYLTLRCDDWVNGNDGTYSSWNLAPGTSAFGEDAFFSASLVDNIKPTGVKWVAKELSCARINWKIETNLVNTEDITFKVAWRNWTSVGINSSQLVTIATDETENDYSSTSMDFEIGTEGTLSGMNVITTIDADVGGASKIEKLSVRCSVVVEIT